LPPPTQYPADENTIILAWHTRENAPDIAKRLGIGVGELERAWRQLKLERKLPHGSRKCNADSDASNHHDGRSRVDTLWHEDALLAKLYAVHEAPRADLYPGLKRRVRR